MSNPDLTSEMAHFLQDNMVQFLIGATEEELSEFVNTLLPHISPVGVNRVYPVVSEAFPSRLLPLPIVGPEELVEEYDDDYDVRLNPLRQPNPEKEGTNGD